MRPLRVVVPSKVRVRCCHCQARRTLAKHPDKYATPGRVPACRRCGRKRYRVDTWRQRHEVGKNAPRPCRCHWYSFPHHKGRGYCIHNAAITAEHAEQREKYS